MKFGFRTPSLKKRIAARTSWKRIVRHSMGLKAPRGYGWLTNPRRALYNRVYHRTTIDPIKLTFKLLRPRRGAPKTNWKRVGKWVFFLILFLVLILPLIRAGIM